MKKAINISRQIQKDGAEKEFKTNQLSQNNGSYPTKRLRRLRSSPFLRDIIAETSVSKDDLIYPIFVEENLQERSPIQSMPGIFRESEKSLEIKLKEMRDEGLKSVMLFGVSHNKDSIGSDSLKPGGLLDRMVSRAKNTCPELVVMADLCFCEYTDHGHCGTLQDDGDVDNDRTLDNLAQQAIIAANAGADIVAPSGMMDGMVAAIRQALDQDGHTNTCIVSYSAKYASHFYGPFRDAAGCSLGHQQHCLSDRKTYQMDPGNRQEALREVALDIEEGTDMIIVKPGLPYLDVIREVKDNFNIPTLAYNVSGEYAMIKLAAASGCLDLENAVMELLTCFKRAGADAILTYFALDVAKTMNKYNQS